jgi:hypothetical protein
MNRISIVYSVLRNAMAPFRIALQIFTISGSPIGWALIFSCRTKEKIRAISGEAAAIATERLNQFHSPFSLNRPSRNSMVWPPTESRGVLATMPRAAGRGRNLAESRR